MACGPPITYGLNLAFTVKLEVKHCCVTHSLWVFSSSSAAAMPADAMTAFAMRSSQLTDIHDEANFVQQSSVFSEHDYQGDMEHSLILC
jgi:hypothetical protein